MKNIKIAYLLTFFFNLTFWSGIWLLYYQRFTDYSGVGIVETFAILTAFIIEIPTGALADIVGRKKTIILAFLIRAIGETIMGFATLFFHLPLSVVFISSGYSFLSGSYEALVYDTLKENNQEDLYPQVLANTKTVELLARALAAFIGGVLLYGIAPGLPFIATAIASTIGFSLAWFLKEPSIDTEKIPIKKYLYQTQQGFKQIFSPKLKPITLSLFVLAVFYLIMYEVGGDALIVELGFNEKELGAYFSILFITSAAATQLTTKLQKIFSPKNLIVFITLLFALILITAPLINPYLAATILLISAWIHFIFDTTVSTILNRQIESKDRATSISTFKMIQAAPYAILAFFIGKIMDILTARGFSILIGILLIIALMPTYFTLTKHQKNLKI